MRASGAPARAGPRARDRALGGLILVVLTAGSFFFWLGIPVLVLWGLSTATESSARHFVLGLIAVPTAMAMFAPLMMWLNGAYLRVTGADPVENTDRRRPRLGGPLEFLLISSLLISIVALLIWFFLFAENPPRQFI